MRLSRGLILPRPSQRANPGRVRGVRLVIRGRIWFAIVSTFLGLSVFAGADELKDESTQLPGMVGKEATADLVNLIFLFDRVGSKPPRVITRDYVERAAQPTSPLYRDYLAYREGKIDREDLANRLPHIAMLGDSLSQHFYVSSIPSSFWRARTVWRNNWFIDTDPEPNSVFSIYERLERVTPLVAEENNGAGAEVTSEHSQENLRQRLIRARNLPGQSRHVQRQARFPDLIMIWIGHNNLDWAHGLSQEERNHPDTQLTRIAGRFRKNYTLALRPLINRAKTENHRVAIVVFGLANVDAYLKARQQIAILKAKNPELYPHFDSAERTFESLKPPYRKNMARLAFMLNGEMRAMVNELNAELRGSPSVRIEYSDALTRVDFSRVDLVNSIDAWHFSIKGHNTVAQAAFRALGPSLDFLGITRGARNRQQPVVTVR